MIAFAIVQSKMLEHLSEQLFHGEKEKLNELVEIIHVMLFIVFIIYLVLVNYFFSLVIYKRKSEERK